MAKLIDHATGQAALEAVQQALRVPREKTPRADITRADITRVEITRADAPETNLPDADMPRGVIAPLADGDTSANSGSGPDLDSLLQGVPRPALATAVRYSLQLLAEQYPGRAVEVRVPPFGAVQILAGTTHRRGTPPAVIETSAPVWLALVTGQITWDGAVAQGQVSASGQRTDLSGILPLKPIN